MYKSELFLENEMYNILFDFEIKTDLIPDRRPDLVLIC